MRLGQRATEHGEVLGENEDGAAGNRAPAGHHAVAGNLLGIHAEIDGAMLDEHVEFLERPLVEQQRDPLAGGQLALGVLRLDAAGPATGLGFRAALGEPVENKFHRALSEKMCWPVTCLSVW